MRWATGKEDIEYKKVTKVIPGSPNAFGIKATLINDANASEQTLFVGFLSRMLLEFMAPKQWLKLVHAGFEFFASGGKAPNVSPTETGL